MVRCAAREMLVEKRPKTMELDRLLILFLGGLALVLGLKYLKQYLSLMFTLLTLKFVWIILFAVIVLSLMKKRT